MSSLVEYFKISIFPNNKREKVNLNSKYNANSLKMELSN